MSLYNMIHGVNKLAGLVMIVLGKKATDFGRFRDAGFDNGRMFVRTRCGGGNREGYQHVFDAISLHPLYLADEDDDFDSTFATFYFKIPARSEYVIEGMEAEGIPPESKSAVWELLDLMRDSPPAPTLYEMTMGAIEKLRVAK